MVCLGAALVLGAAAQSQPSWRCAVVVLVEGERVLTGEILEQGDVILLKCRVGPMRIARSDVFRICESLHALYEVKRTESEPRDPDEHVRLSQWCRRYGLREQALQELQAALRLDPGHAQARIMYESMAHLSAPRKARAAPDTPRTHPTRAKGGGGSLPATYDRWLVVQRRDVIEQFAGRVQMLLLNHCASGKCHGGKREGGLQLVRPVSGIRSKTLTQKNLRAVYRCLEFGNLETSPILVKPLLPRGGGRLSHGGGRIFTSADDRTFRILRDWTMGLQRSQKRPAGRAGKNVRKPGTQTKKR